MPNKVNLAFKKIILIGIGGIGKCISHYLDQFFTFDYDKLYIVDKDKLQSEFVTVKRLLDLGAHFIHKNITSNYKTFFNDLIKSGDIVIDATARTPCIKWLNYLTKMNIYYINTSIECDSIHENNSKASLYKNSISYQHKQLLELDPNGRFLIEYGTNPGLITSFCKQALDDIAKYLGKGPIKNYAKFAESIEINEIHCSEIDTQLGRKIDRKIFNNTWSAVGLLDELVESSEIYLGDKPTEQIVELSKNSVKAKYVDSNDVILTKTSSLDNRGKSICYTENITAKTLKSKGAKKLNKQFSEITGYLIHHGEILDIGTMLKTPKWSPTVYYVYDINTEADNSIKERGIDVIHKESYDSTKVNVMNVINNKINGTDNIGIYITTKTGLNWWCGSVLSTDYTQKQLNDKYFGPTVIQVMCGVLGGLSWLLEQKKGMYFGRHVNHTYVLNKMNKLLNIKSTKVNL